MILFYQKQIKSLIVSKTSHKIRHLIFLEGGVEGTICMEYSIVHPYRYALLNIQIFFLHMRLTTDISSNHRGQESNLTRIITRTIQFCCCFRFCYSVILYFHSTYPRFPIVCNLDKKLQKMEMRKFCSLIRSGWSSLKHCSPT